MRKADNRTVLKYYERGRFLIDGIVNIDTEKDQNFFLQHAMTEALLDRDGALSQQQRLDLHTQFMNCMHMLNEMRIWLSETPEEVIQAVESANILPGVEE